MRLPPRIALLKDEDGAVALIAAASMTAVLAFGALVADLGAIYSVKRDLQAATDAAALSATFPIAESSTAPNAAQTFANTYLAKNITGATAVATSGTYCPDTGLAQGSRFTAAQVACADNSGINGYNAVQVTSSVVTPFYFGAALMKGVTSKTLTAKATAAQIDEAGFYAGSGLLSVATMNNAILNALLPGSTITLSSYSGLVGANINALTFLNALATNLNLSAGTYSSVLQSTVTIPQIIQSEIDALNAPGSIAVAELNQLKASVAGSPTLSVSNLFDLGVWQNLPVGATNSATALVASLNAYQLLTISAQLANGSNAVAIPATSLNIPGVATVSAASTVIEPPQGPGFVFAPIGTTANPVTVHTAQVRLQLNLQLLSALSLGGTLGSAPVNVPVYVEVGSGDATLSGISCGYNPATDATVTISAQSGVANAYVGTVMPSAMSNFSSPVTVSPATLVNLLNVVQVTGSAHVALSSASATSLVFDQTQIADLTPQSVESSGMLSNLLQTLGNGGNLSLSISSPLVLGVPVVSTSAVTALLTPLLAPVFAGLDTLVDSTLAALGIKIGYLSVTATGVRCGVPTLVN